MAVTSKIRWFQIVEMFFSPGPQLKSLSLPDCWIKDFFMAHMYTELQMIKEALQKYQNLIEAGFSKSTYIISQIAVAYHNIRGMFFTFSVVLHHYKKRTGSAWKEQLSPFWFQILTKLWLCSMSWGIRIHTESTTWTHSPTCCMSKWVCCLMFGESLERWKSEDIKMVIFRCILEHETRVELLGSQPCGDW